MKTMKPFSSSQRLRRTVAVAVVIAFAIALVLFGLWKRFYSTKDNYRDMVTAFYTGVVAMEAGDDSHSLSSLTEATQLAPEEPAAWADLGLFYLRHSNYEEANKALQKARGLAPQNAQVASLYALLQQQQSHFPEAIAAYRQAVQSDPNAVKAHYALEQVLEQESGPGSGPEP